MLWAILFRCFLTGGQEANITQAHVLIAGLEPDMVIVDRGYDANYFVEAITAIGAQPVFRLEATDSTRESMQ